MIPDAKGKTLLQRLNAVQDEVDYVQKEKKPGMPTRSSAMMPSPPRSGH